MVGRLQSLSMLTDFVMHPKNNGVQYAKKVVALCGFTPALWQLEVLVSFLPERNGRTTLQSQAVCVGIEKICEEE